LLGGALDWRESMMSGTNSHVKGRACNRGLKSHKDLPADRQSRYHPIVMNELDRVQPPPPNALLRASRRLLRPLVRLLMRAGVTFPVLSDLLRALYVEVATTELLTDERARTDSRVSLLTGVHRKEIRRLRLLPPDSDTIPPAVTVGSQIVARWLVSDGYSDAKGQPLALPRSARADGGPSFEALVESVTTDVRPRAVLDDWISQGIAVVGPDDCVRLQASAFLPRRGSEEQMFYFARNLHDHIAAAVLNVSVADSPPFLDRAVHYDGLDDSTARALETIARQAAQQVLMDVNRAAIALVDAMPAHSAARGRVNFGVYVYRDEDPDPEAPTA